MVKALFTFLFLGLIICCKSQHNVVDLIIYSDFANPRAVYDSIIDDISKLELTDSIKIIGQPIYDKIVEIQVDSLRLKELGLTENEVWEKIGSKENSNNISQLMELKIRTATGQYVPLTLFASFYYISTYYKPDIYIPEPEFFYFKNRKAVKLEFFCKTFKASQLIEYLKNNIERFSNVGLKTEYEIVK